MAAPESPTISTPTRRWRRFIRSSVLWVAVLLIWALGAFTYFTLHELTATGLEADRAQNVRYEAERLLSLLKDAETGQRGFIITGDDAYLEPYEAAKTQTHEVLAALHALITDDPEQRRRLDNLEALVIERLAQIAANIDLRRSQGSAPFAIDRLHHGKATMDKVRDEVAAVIAQQSARYSQVKALAEEEARTSMQALFLGIVISTIGIGVVFWLVIQEIKRRRAAEAELRLVNDELEQRVRKRTAQIERQRRFLSATLTHMHDGLFINKGGRIVFVNDECLRLLGADSAQQVIGRSPLDFTHPDDKSIIVERIKALQQPGVRLPINEQRVVRLDGNTIEVDVTSVSFMDEGELGILVILRDITQRKATERQLRHAHRLEAVGQLTGGLAHDFNNLLAVIIGNLDLLEEELRNNPKAGELAAMALKASLRGAELTRQLLAFSRQQTLQAQAFDLNDLVNGTIRLLRRTLGEDIEIITHLADDLWPVFADSTQVESALANLAINARDAMANGGYLTIETSNRHLDEQYAQENTEVTPGDYVMLAVSDTGAGIPPEVMSKVFEPFFTTKKDGKGSGLGLAMIYGFAKQSGGHIKIYSEVGYGTTVRLYLPRAEMLEKTAAVDLNQEPAMAQPPAAAVILVVDDNPDVRSVAVRQLNELGHRTIEAQDAEDALRILAQDQPIDLLFTDVVMPGGMRGDELARQARLLRPAIKVLFTSGFAEASIENGHRSSEVKRCNLLSKPYRKQDLAQRIEEILRNPAAPL